jgi:hypothetical protein
VSLISKETGCVQLRGSKDAIEDVSAAKCWLGFSSPLVLQAISVMKRQYLPQRAAVIALTQKIIDVSSHQMNGINLAKPLARVTCFVAFRKQYGAICSASTKFPGVSRSKILCVQRD